MKRTFLLICALAFAVLADARSKREQAHIFLKSGDTLHVQVIDSVSYRGVGEYDRFLQFKKTMEEVFEEIDFPMNYRITRFGANRRAPNQPRLDITIMKWGNSGFSEIEARFSASLRFDYDLNKLGVFHYRDGPTIGTSDMMTRVYNDILKKALIKMMMELDGRLVYDTMTEGEIDLEAQEDPDSGRQ